MCTKAARKCSELLPPSFGSEGVQGRMCGPRKYSYPTCGGLLEFREGGAFKTKILKGESEAKLDFPDTWVVGW